MTVLLFGRLQFADLARYPLLAGGERVDIARDPFHACCKFVDVARCLLLGDGNPVNYLPHRVEINRYCIKPLLIGRRGSLRRQAGCPGSAICNRRRPRRQPVSLRVRARDELPGRVAVGMPGQGGTYSDAKRDQ